MFKYFKAAFINRWNLLFFTAGLVFAGISGAPDVVAPLVLAGEVAYLGLLGAHPKFQHYIEAQEAKAAREALKANAPSPQQTVDRILDSLPDPSVRRFESLRTRCTELRQLASELRDPNRIGTPAPLEEMQIAGLDRLLWIYLRLLFTEHSLERFLARTRVQEIEADIQRLEARLAESGDVTADPRHERLRKVLTDNLETSRTRLGNYRKATDNLELVKLELDSLENKIRSLSELAINRHEPEFISGQVDRVVNGMVQTEQTMSDLQFVTGLQPLDEEVPELLERPRSKVRA